MTSLASRLGLVVAVLLGACATPPIDPHGTTERVREGVLRAGATEHPPWIVVDAGNVSGVEAELVAGFAASLGTEVAWTIGSEEELFGALELGQLDVIVGGLSDQSPFQEHAALTRPYLTVETVIAVPASEPVPDEIAGLEVAVEEGTEEAGLLAETDAEPIYVSDVMSASGARVVEDWQLDDLELAATDVVLGTTNHAMAVRLGENGFMVALEMFLLERRGTIDELLSEHSGP